MNTPKKTSREDWHPADIRAALDKKGWTLAALAAHHQLNASSFSQVLAGRSYPANEKRIADAIGVKPQDIWPSLYNEDGSKKPRGLQALRELQSTQLRGPRNGNDRLAA